MKLPKVNIIVPVYKEHKEIVELLNSLENLNYPKEMFNIIIVKDSGRTKEVDFALEQFKQNLRIKVLQSPGRGSARNRNFAIEHIDEDCKYLAFTDADCLVDPEWLNVLVNTIENNNVDVVGGINLTPEDDNFLAKGISIMENTFLGGAGSAQGTLFKKITPVNSIPNCNAMYKKELWLKNKQNEKLIVGQDGEFNLRLRKQGAKFLINPKAKVFHHRPGSFRIFRRRIINYGKATTNLFKLHSDLIIKRWYGFVPPLFIVGMILLAILSYLDIIFAYVFGIALILYEIAIILTTIEALLKSRKLISLLIIFLLPLQHFFYAIGFLKGLLTKL